MLNIIIMIDSFDFIVVGWIKSNGFSQMVKIPVSVDTPSCDKAVNSAMAMLPSYEFVLESVKPISEGLAKKCIHTSKNNLLL